MAASIECPECGGHITRKNQTTGGWIEHRKQFGCPHCNTFFDVPRSPFDYLSRIFVVLAVLQLLTVLLNLWDGHISWINIIGAALMILLVIHGRRRFAQMAASLRKLQSSIDQ
jgi:hypothetical protein